MSGSSSKSERSQLEQAILVQENLRGQIDDAIIDTTIAALREKLILLTPFDNEQHRKQVTALFMDIVDSTGMMQGFDPEENMAVMDGALQAMTGAIKRHDGIVTRYMGDGFLALFGHPVAKEDDAIRAVKAGLDILEIARAYAETVRESYEIPDFQVRVGINTGIVLIGGSSEGNETLAGNSINLAARLESGTAWVNQHGPISPNVPFGGVKCSGIGVEFAEEGLAEYTTIQVVNVAKSAH